MKFTSLAIAFAVVGTEAIKIEAEIDPISCCGAVAFNAVGGCGVWRAMEHFDEEYCRETDMEKHYRKERE